MANIRDLLKKKSLTGEEVGRAIIASLAHDAAGGDAPLFTQEELEEMKRALVTEEDIEIYNGYVRLESTLLLYQSLQQGYWQQAQHGLNRLFSYVTQARRAQELKTILTIMPAGTSAEVLEALESMVELDDILDPRFDTERLRMSADGLLIPALRQIYAYNAFFDILASKYAMDEIRAFKIDISLMEVQIDGYHDARGVLDALSLALDGSSIAAVLPPIDYEALKPSKSTMSVVDSRLPELIAYRRPPLSLIDMLTGKEAV